MIVDFDSKFIAPNSKYFSLQIPDNYNVLHRTNNINNISFKYWDTKKNINRAKGILMYTLVFIDVIFGMFPIKKKNRKLNLYIINYDLKKSFNDVTSFKCINSGLTISNTTSQIDVYVYRKEELLKVLFHELLHAYDVGIHGLTNKKIDELYKSKNSINLNEAIVETLACIFNASFYYALNRNIVNKHDVFNNELRHARIQANTILNKKRYDYKTNTLSYYVLKSIFLEDIEGFLQNYKNPYYIVNTILNTKIKRTSETVNNSRMSHYEILI